jgi:hypothetical protein
MRDMTATRRNVLFLTDSVKKYESLIGRIRVDSFIQMIAGCHHVVVAGNYRKAACDAM